MSCQKNSCGCQQSPKTTATSHSPSMASTHKQSHIAKRLPFQFAFLHPRYWGIWLMLIVILPLILLPLRGQFWLGRHIGIIAFHLAKKRQKDTLTNLRLAYPDKDDTQRFAIAKQVFINQGIGIFESLCAWWRPEVFVRTFSISGLQHLVQAQKQGRAVILLGMHFTVLDLGGRIATQFFAADCVYRKQNNPLLEWLVYNSRVRIFDEQIAHKDMRKLATRLKAGKIIWYTPDQDFGLEHGVMAEFFGVPAATITAQRRFARLGNKQKPPALIMMSFARQTPDFIAKGKRPHYHLSLSPILDNYPSDDELLDAIRLNQLIENAIRQNPTQWMWFHRRFKTQADGKNYYA